MTEVTARPDYSICLDLDWQAIQVGITPARYDAVISTRIHPNELATHVFHERAARESLPNTRLLTPNDFLADHERTTNNRFIRGANLGLQFPSLEAYVVGRNTSTEGSAQELAWDIRRVFSDGLVGIDVHAGAVEAEDYALLHPQAQFPARALARYLLGPNGDINEAIPGTLPASATNTLIYEIAGGPDVVHQKVERLYQRLRTALDGGLLQFLRTCHPNDGARYSYKEVGSIDYLTARNTLMFWDESLGNWRVIEPRLVQTTPTGMYTAKGVPVVRLGDTTLPQNALAPEGCEDIPGFFFFYQPGIIRTPLRMTGTIPGGTDPAITGGVSWYAEIRTDSTVDHSIKHVEQPEEAAHKRDTL